MITGEARVTVRNSALLLAQRGVYVAGGLLFAALVPRLMRPGVYGQYALLTSISAWFLLLTALGSTPVLGRHASQLARRGEVEPLQKLFAGYALLRLASGALAAGLFLLVMRLWLPDIALAALGAVAGALLIRAASQPLFDLSLGLNRAARWAAAETTRRWVSVLLVVAGFLLAGLPGACLGLLLSEVAVLALGVAWSRPYLAAGRPRLDLRFLAPYLRLGLIFAASDLLVSAFANSGEVLVQAATGDYAQVGYFGLADNVYRVASQTISQFVLAFLPLLSALQAGGEADALRAWVERILKWLAVGGVFLVYGALFLAADLVPPLFGAAYRPAAAYLLPLALTLLLQGVVSVGHVLAIACDRPRVVLAAVAARLGVFWLLGFPLVAWQGGLGACLTVLVATAVCGGYYALRLRDVAGRSVRKWALVAALGALFLPLAWLRGSWPANLALYGATAAASAGLLFGLRLITPHELRAVWQALWRVRVGAEG
ncbi:MAG: oligosaccharide flippase family protein [Anaerolineae bacterium]|nr:oligosaccharide flippase family protein [Anaerolineae bacterium]